MFINTSGSVSDGYLLDENNSIVEGLCIMEVHITPNSRLIMHPVENGMSRVDNKVIQPRRITVRGYVTAGDSDTHDKLREMWLNRKLKFCKVIDKDGSVYKNLMVVNIPHRSNSQMYDMCDYTIELQEVMFSLESSDMESDPGWSSETHVGTVHGVHG